VGGTSFDAAIVDKRLGVILGRLAALPWASEKHLASSYFGGHLPTEDLDRIAAATAGFTCADFEQAGRQGRGEGQFLTSPDIQPFLKKLGYPKPRPAAGIAIPEARRGN